MKTNSNTSTTTSVNAISEVTRFSLGIGISAAVIISLWAAACLLSSFFSNGIGGTISSLISSITGV